MRRFILYIVMILPAFPLVGQDVQVTAAAPAVVAVGEQYRLTFTMNTKPDSFNPPDLSEFYILMGPSTSYSQSTQIINNKITRSVTYTYTYLLQATREGKFTIAPATISVKKRSYNSNSIDIEVVKGNVPANAGTGQAVTDSEKTPDNINNEDLFLRILVDKQSVFQGEHVIATVKIYSRINLSGFENAKFPAFNGFLREDIETPQLRSLERENVNGVIYGTGVLQRVVLFPQRSGEMIIDPMELECLIQQKVQSNTRNFFDDFFDSYRNVKKVIKSPVVKINVKPLPAEKPSSFTGGVGRFSMTTSLDKTELKENEALTLQVAVSGNGNLKLVEPPDIDFPPDFETFDPKISNNIKHTTNGSSGTKTLEYLVIPRHSGTFRIPPVEFSYFDARENSFRNLSSDEFTVSVLKGDEDETGTVVSGLSKEDVRFIGKDIRFIKDETVKLLPLDKTLFGSIPFYLSYVLALFLFSALVLLRRNHIKRTSDLALVRNRQANRVARKRLKIASNSLKTGDHGRFYEEILKAIWGYIRDKLNIAVSELSEESVRKILGDREVEQEMVDELMEVIDSCEYARFSPSKDDSQTELIYTKASMIISKFEQKK